LFALLWTRLSTFATLICNDVNIKHVCTYMCKSAGVALKQLEKNGNIPLSCYRLSHDMRPNSGCMKYNQATGNRLYEYSQMCYVYGIMCSIATSWHMCKYLPMKHVRVIWEWIHAVWSTNLPLDTDTITPLWFVLSLYHPCYSLPPDTDKSVRLCDLQWLILMSGTACLWTYILVILGFE
jgi:hypothetical protein